MIAGAVGIAALGVAMIPMAYALGQFANVDWDTIKMAGGSLMEFGKIGAKLSLISPLLLIGSVAIGALGTALIPFASAINILSKGKLSDIGNGLKAMGSGLTSLTGSSVGSGLSSLFSGDPFKQLEQLATIADPLDIAAKAINLLGESIQRLSVELKAADFTKLSEFEKMKGVASQVGIGFKMRGATEAAQPPSVESTAQNIAVPEPPKPETVAQNVVIKEQKIKDETTVQKQDPIQVALDEAKSNGGNKRLELLMMQLINEMKNINNRPMILEFSDGTIKNINYRLKGMNGNR